MKRKKTLFLKILSLFIALSIVITFVINTVIANNVISAMSDVRVEINSTTFADYDLAGEQMSVTSNDGLEINAYVVPNKNSKGNVVILHGMHGMDASSLLDYAKFIYDAGYTAINVDMRAHGFSEGDRLSFGYNEVDDVIAVIDFLKEDDRFKDAPIILYGLSMGGSTAINTAAVSEYVDGVIAVSPFLSIKNQVGDYMARDGFPEIFITIFEPSVNLVLLRKFGVNSIKKIPQHSVANINDIPLFIIHSNGDKQTAVYHSEVLYDLASSNQKQIWIVDGDEHLIVEDVLGNESIFYRTRILAYLKENFGN